MVKFVAHVITKRGLSAHLRRMVLNMNPLFRDIKKVLSPNYHSLTSRGFPGYKFLDQSEGEGEQLSEQHNSPDWGSNPTSRFLARRWVGSGIQALTFQYRSISRLKCFSDLGRKKI